MLTAKQHQLLQYIENYMVEKGICPSFEEMKKAIKLRSKSGVHRLITALEERGFLRRLPNRARALEVIKKPKNETSGTEKRAKMPSLSGFSIPFLGKIAAGSPIEAIADNTNSIEIPQTMVGRGQYYALTVAGDSMIEEGIYDGDIAVIQQTQTADDGQIVVALVDDEDVTLKTLRRRKTGEVELIPANARLKPQIYSGKRVKVQGVLKGLLRKYN